MISKSDLERQIQHVSSSKRKMKRQGTVWEEEGDWDKEQ